MLQLAHRGKGRRAAGIAADALRSAASASCGPMSLSTRRRMRPRSAPAAAFRPMAPPIEVPSQCTLLQAQLVQQRRGQLRVEGQAVLLRRAAGSIGSGRGRGCRGRSRASAAPGARRCRPCRARCAPGRARRSPSRRGRRPIRCSAARGLAGSGCSSRCASCFFRAPSAQPAHHAGREVVDRQHEQHAQPQQPAVGRDQLRQQRHAFAARRRPASAGPAGSSAPARTAPRR